MKALTMTTQKKNDVFRNYIVYLIMCIILNYLLLDYLFSPQIIIMQTDSSQLIENSISEITDVPILSQLPLLPTGCEAVSAAMLLQWLGQDVSISEIANALPKGDVPSYKNGQLIGPNPNKEFIGNPFSKKGFGVYHKPIYDILDSYMPNKFKDITGYSFNDLLEVIDNKQPVLVWATINMSKPSINSIWHDELGNKIIWKVPEHAMVLVGYSKSLVIVNDPLAGKKMYYNKIDFKNYWEYMGSQAIIVNSI